MLFKYLVADRVDVLERRRIRFTQAVALNDPFELQPYFAALIDESSLVEEIGSGPIDITPQLVRAYDQLEPHLRPVLPLEQFLMWIKAVLDTEEGQREGAALPADADRARQTEFSAPTKGSQRPPTGGIISPSGVGTRSAPLTSCR